MSHSGSDILTSFQGRIGWLRGANQILVIDDKERVAYVNFAEILFKPQSDWRKIFDEALKGIKEIAQTESWGINISPQFINYQAKNEIEWNLSVNDIDNLLDCITLFVSMTYKNHLNIFTPEAFSRYDINKHRGLVRTGNVELRVVENFLRDPQRLQRALKNVVANMTDYGYMYASGKSRSWCTADDYEWNIRKLMTNAGFYVSDNYTNAWRSLENWAIRYIAALEQNFLASSNHTYLFSFVTQNILHDKSDYSFKYILHPDAFNIYDQIKEKKIVFVSPLSHLIEQQYKSGKIWNLYKNKIIPRFNLTTAPAWISTWPNRPHLDWSDTFSNLCSEVDELAKKQHFDVFICSCGCYGLPLANYVRTRYDCAVLYLGNVTNAYFGVLQNATQDFMKQHQNTEAFVRGDLSNFKNIELIDNGRYV